MSKCLDRRSNWDSICVLSAKVCRVIELEHVYIQSAITIQEIEPLCRRLATPPLLYISLSFSRIEFGNFAVLHNAFMKIKLYQPLGPSILFFNCIMILKKRVSCGGMSQCPAKSYITSTIIYIFMKFFELRLCKSNGNQSTIIRDR